MNCPKCGKPYSEGENFCTNCGWALEPSLSGYRHASLLSRFLAYLIDALLILVPITLIMLYHLLDKYGEQLLLDPVLFTDVIIKESLLITSISVLASFVYFALLEGRFQATIGKKLLRLKVVKKDFSPIGYSEAAVRNFLRLLWQLPVGVFIMIIDAFLVLSKYQRIGDMAAQTYVMSTS